MGKLRRWSWREVGFAVAAGAAIGGAPALGADGDPAGEIDDLRARVAALEREREQGRRAGAAAASDSGAAAAAEPDPGAGLDGGATAGEPQPLAWHERIQLGVFVDVYFAYNSNEPGDGDDEGNFLPGTGSTGKRAERVDLNLAALDLRLEPEPVGFHLALVYGTGTQVLHVGEPDGDGDLAEVSALDLLYRAAIEVELPVFEGLRIEAGIFPSPIGFEGFYSRDNFNYTRSYLGELSPYYLCGMQATARLTEALSARAFVVNGFQLISENNRAKGVGGQIAYATGGFSLAVTGFAGPELPDDVRSWRLFGDVVASFAPRDGLEVAAQADLGYQERPGEDDALWHAYAGFVRVTPLDVLRVAARAELFRDPRNGISGVEQTLWALTGTVELLPFEGLSVKLEARYDSSDARVFADRDTDEAGARVRSELMVFIGIAASL